MSPPPRSVLPCLGVMRDSAGSLFPPPNPVPQSVVHRFNPRSAGGHGLPGAGCPSPRANSALKRGETTAPTIACAHRPGAAPVLPGTPERWGDRAGSAPRALLRSGTPARLETWPWCGAGGPGLAGRTPCPVRRGGGLRSPGSLWGTAPDGREYPPGLGGALPGAPDRRRCGMTPAR